MLIEQSSNARLETAEAAVTTANARVETAKAAVDVAGAAAKEADDTYNQLLLSKTAPPKSSNHPNLDANKLKLDELKAQQTANQTTLVEKKKNKKEAEWQKS